ncbi:MAG TPA: hypothetical protein VJ746_07315 [Nitrospira sp.]|nr:hypothetical protein [Nitrospira sp.]
MTTVFAVLTIEPEAVSHAATPPGQVGAAMALLATLEDADVLPPEGTSEANRVIKIVIQFQSTFMKSTNPAVRDFFQHAMVKQFGNARAAEIDSAFSRSGWSTPVVEALDHYQATASNSEVTALTTGFSQFNVTTADFDYFLELFRKARLAYQRRGQDIHRVFAECRQRMPGAS